ncbi:hypothetical protein PsYK624_052940 [Phanerochaete sordida]|uniref:Uncharacterized protein n=1 Tax=Phanerochaete sordida TaxID=48140 RepID=A0A9P3LC48_9APHY|nr:hypothetical protein PsYK624_052940 [Phanerochaete sordida]
MHLVSHCSLIIAASAIHALASPAKRQGINIVDSPGAISAPADGTVVTADQTFPFGLSAPIPERIHCYGAYTNVNVYLLDSKPTTSSLNSTQGFTNYLFYFGNYIVDNIPEVVPPIDPIPPSSLTADTASRRISLTVVSVWCKSRI